MFTIVLSTIVKTYKPLIKKWISVEYSSNPVTWISIWIHLKSEWGVKKQVATEYIQYAIHVNLFFFFFPLCHVACGILVPQLGIKPPFPGLEKWSLNPWNTREVSHLCKSLIIISIMDTFIGTKSMKMGIGRILMSKEAGNWAWEGFKKELQLYSKYFV